MHLPQQRRPGELVFVFILVGFSAAAIWQAYLISGFTGLSKPGVFPMLAAATMLVSGLFILRDTFAIEPAGSKNGVSVFGQFIRDVTPLRFIIMLAIVTAYLFAMPWLGFVISSGLFLLISFVFLWRKSFWVSFLLALVALGAVYFVFRIVFQVVLPQGSLIPPGIF